MGRIPITDADDAGPVTITHGITGEDVAPVGLACEVATLESKARFALVDEAKDPIKGVRGRRMRDGSLQTARCQEGAVEL